MNKRGALFYIIDAFVAASIIAMTLTVVFSSHINMPKNEQTKTTLDHYLSFLQETPIKNLDDDHLREVIINQRYVDNTNTNLLITLGLILKENNLTLAEELLNSINTIALPVQYGINFTMTIDNQPYQLTTRHPERREKAKTYFERTIISWYERTPKIRSEEVTITNTGDEACQALDLNCIYINTSTTAFFTNECGNAHSGATAKCYAYNKSQSGKIEAKVSLWS